jgi:predicted nuclease of predicted toxin-antitoxin system
VLRFLIDECCTPEIVAVALTRGYHAAHVRYVGLGGASDRALMPVITAQDYSFVTNNRSDFLKLYRETPLHAGLLIIVPSVAVDEQCRLMGLILDAIAAAGHDIVNKLVEVHADGRVEIGAWPVPKDSE